jgi:hypothetical protein
LLPPRAAQSLARKSSNCTEDQDCHSVGMRIEILRFSNTRIGTMSCAARALGGDGEPGRTASRIDTRSCCAHPSTCRTNLVWQTLHGRLDHRAKLWVLPVTPSSTVKRELVAAYAPRRSPAAGALQVSDSGKHTAGTSRRQNPWRHQRGRCRSCLPSCQQCPFRCTLCPDTDATLFRSARAQTICSIHHLEFQLVISIASPLCIPSMFCSVL